MEIFKQRREMHRYNFILLFLVFLVGCSFKSPGLELLDSSTCVAPCWMGISPGSTSEAELRVILDDLAASNKNEVGSKIDSTNDEKSFYLELFPKNDKSNSPRILLDVYLQKGVVEQICFSGDIDLSIKDVASRFGEPTDIIPALVSQGYTATIINRDFGYEIMLAINMFRIFSNNNDEEISENRKIIRLCFFNPIDFQEMVESDYYHSREIQTWIGYGNIREKYPF
jgi:hypothetical protein